MQILTHSADPLSAKDPAIAVQTSFPTLRIVALGDSLIYGFGDSDGGGWVERLRRRWMSPEGHHHALYNLGVRGDRVQQVAQRLKTEFHNRGELRHRVPDGILLSVGLNDSARLGRADGKNFTPFESFQLDIANLLDQANQLCPVFFVGMTPVDEAQMPFSNCLYYNHADQYLYKEATRLACQERQIPYLDVFDQWMARGEGWWRSRLHRDGLHPNSEGYAALLEDFQQWQPICRWLGHYED
ncbi:MAG: GDSL-type esterase/lipase family protein [Oculatellaceae cyanobacterium Prado106]|jgi:lysophospholipase L1-like esterase|nr:GDSL-type esterase/lipase family protein [Oculatellaceae cyanobacterium Prado106]